MPPYETEPALKEPCLPDWRAEVTRYLDAELLRYPGQIAVVGVDMDDLKDRNDTKGHAAGDVDIALTHAVLSAHARSQPSALGVPGIPAQRLPDTVIRPDGLALRWGGDEFLVVLRGPVIQDDVDAYIKRVREVLARHGVYVSMGGRTHRLGETAAELIDDVDKLAQRDKLDRVPNHSQERETRLLAIEAELREMGITPRGFPKHLAAIRLRRMLRAAKIAEIESAEPVRAA